MLDGTAVVVKVQRPHIAGVIEKDLDILHFLARQAEKRRIDLIVSPTEIVKEFETAISEELDFTYEAANLKRFKKNFEGEVSVVVPTVLEHLSTQTVLTMEYIEGVKITDYASIGCSAEEISKVGTRAVLKQVFDDGFFHADPHPANIFVLPGNRICFLDLGQMGRLSEENREKIVLLMAALAREDRELTANTLYGICLKEVRIDLRKFREDVRNLLDSVYERSLSQINLSIVLKGLMDLATSHQMKFPSAYSLMVKSLVTIEVTAKKINPQLNLIDSLRPVVLKYYSQKLDPSKLSQDLVKNIIQLSDLGQDLPIQLGEIVHDLRKGALTINVQSKDHKKIAQQLDRLTLRLCLTLIVSSILVSASFWVTSQMTRFEPSAVFIGSIFCLLAVFSLWLLTTVFKRR
jgi:ubiquinone biosynthesis protein